MSPRSTHEPAPIPRGLPNGSKVAIIGGGVSGMALGASLALGSRARGRKVEIAIYAGASEEWERPPLLLTAECRARLAALGGKVPREWVTRELRALEVISAMQVERLPFPPAGLWVLDGWERHESGAAPVVRSLASVAAAFGARIECRQVDWVGALEQPEAAKPGAWPEQAVWSRGASEKFNAVALAVGAETAWNHHLFPGFQGPPVISAVHARINVRNRVLFDCLRLLLSPCPGVEGLYLIPAGATVHAMAYGERIGVADLCRALMAAAREGWLPADFELLNASARPLAAGAGRCVAGAGQLALGASAFGHPLQVGISEALASVSRATLAFLESEGPNDLPRRYLRAGMSDLLFDARTAVRATRWLRRCGPRAARAVAAARRADSFVAPFSGGVLGLPSPTPSRLLGCARWAAIGHWLGGAVAPSRLPPAPVPEVRTRPLYYVVDDDSALRESLQMLLEERGAEVQIFGDELSLLTAIARRPPTAIFLDVVLQWVDGLSLCAEVKRRPPGDAVPVIVMSGLQWPNLEARAREAGATAFLAKPFEREALMRVLGPPDEPLQPAPSPGKRVESGLHAS